jgi:antagonist of KipI
MDPVSHALANALVGNDPGEAALELTLIGPELQFEEPTLVALCGAEFDALPCARPVLVPAGTRLALGRARRGARACLAVAGGIAVDPVLGSRSTYLPARFGGFRGRALRAGDALPLVPKADQIFLNRFSGIHSRKTRLAGFETVRWSAPPLTLSEHEPAVVHAMEGRHLGRFESAAAREFFDAAWRVSPQSDRMGFRLLGPRLARSQSGEILSEPTCLGTVQVPAGGAPIVLMADHQTTGGYPKIAEVASADAARLAQLAPGAELRFARCTLEEALALGKAARARLGAALRAIAWEFGK